ncbi:MAG TPA: hypothetical protein VGN34_34820, partial [Ktedonobacteraceae bacterium]
RCDDICYFRARDGGERPFFPDTIRRMILLADPRITDYLVVQEQTGQLHIHLALEPGAPFAEIVHVVRQSVEQIIAHYGCLPAIVQVSEGIQVLEPGVKRRRVQRHIS